MSVTYDELTKTLTYTYVDDPIVQKISNFKEKEVHIIEWEITGHAFSPSNVIFKSSMYNESLSSDGKTLVIAPMVSCNESFFHIDFDDTSFAGDKTLEAVIIESGIEKISKESFRGCSSLKRVSFSNTIKDINENAFTGCKLGFRSVYYSTDSIKLMLQHFSRHSLGLLSFSCTNNQRYVSFLFVACLGMSTP